MNLLRPQTHLIEIAKKYPDVWKIVESFRLDRGKGVPDWPDWCFLPLAGAYAPARRKTPRLPPGAIEVSIIAAWLHGG